MAEAVVAELAVVGVTEAAEVVRVAGAAAEAGIRVEAVLDRAVEESVEVFRAVEVAAEAVDIIKEVELGRGQWGEGASGEGERGGSGRCV
jgi:hypothetical protein